MKRVKNLIKLTNLNSERLNEKELCHAMGSGFGYCGCYWANCGGSSDAANSAANKKGGLDSPLPPEGAHYG